MTNEFNIPLANMLFSDDEFISSFNENIEATLQSPKAEKAITNCIDGDCLVGSAMSRVLNLLGGKVVNKKTFECEFAKAGDNHSVYLHGTLAAVEAKVLDESKQKLSQDIKDAIGGDRYQSLVNAVIDHDETVEDTKQAERAIATAFMQAVITEYSQCLSVQNSLSPEGIKEKNQYTLACQARIDKVYEVIKSKIDSELAAAIGSKYQENNKKKIPFETRSYDKLSTAMGGINEDGHRRLLSTIVNKWNNDNGNTTDKQREQGQRHVFNQIIDNVPGDNLEDICEALEASEYCNQISDALKDDDEFKNLKSEEQELFQNAKYSEEKTQFALKYVQPLDFFSNQYQVGEQNIYAPIQLVLPSMDDEDDLVMGSGDEVEYIAQESEQLLPEAKASEDPNANAKSTARKAGAITGALLFAGLGAAIGFFLMPLLGVGIIAGAIIGGIIGGIAGGVVSLGVAEGTIQVAEAMTERNDEAAKNDGFNRSSCFLAGLGGPVASSQQAPKCDLDMDEIPGGVNKPYDNSEEDDKPCNTSEEKENLVSEQKDGDFGFTFI